MQDEILEGFALAIPRLCDILKPGIDHSEQFKRLETVHLSPALRKVVRLATLYRGRDLTKLHEKQPRHRAPL